MDPGGTVPGRVPKRALSRQASSSDLYQDTASLRTQKTSVSNIFYRYHTLVKARIYIRPEPPPMTFKPRWMSSSRVRSLRKREISGIAKKTSQHFINKLRGAHREDNLINLVHKALFMMHKGETFDFSKKAGIVLPLTTMYTSLCPILDVDWDPSLKPEVQCSKISETSHVRWGKASR